MKKQLSFYSFSIIFILLLQSSIFAQNGIPYPANKKLPEVKIYESGKIENFKIEAQTRRKYGDTPTATFEVVYEGFSIEAQLAFAEAVKLWSYLVSSQVPIIINARWEPLSTGVLGSAGAATFRRGFKNAPIDAAWYPIPIANKLAGYDLEPESPDIVARFNKTVNWYLGLDGNCPKTKYDLISVVMHEIGHGLGFIGSAKVDGTMGSWGSETDYPFIFDSFVYNGDNELLIDEKKFTNPSTKLKAEYTSGDIFFNSELSNAANNSDTVPLYAPRIWNEGSSYSHLGEFFNGGPNTMMTYSVGSGEVTHDPGPVTLAMFAELGWVNVLFKHNEVKDIEVMNNPILIETEILSDSRIVDGSVILHYSIDNFVTDSIVMMETLNDTHYTAYIPALISDSVNYYFEVSTSLNRTYYNPSQGVLPVDRIIKTFAFFIGPDLTPPVIVHENIQNIFNFKNELELNFGANDNLGLDTAYIEYKVNNDDLTGLKCDIIGYSNINDLYQYKSSISVKNMHDADTVYYRIIATDFSKVSNTTVLPEIGFFKTAVHDYGIPIVEKVITFDEVGDKNLIIDNRLTVLQPANFSSKGLHSPHPYLEGDQFPTDEIEYSAMLKLPVILKDKDAYFRFDQIVIVEPGDPGSSYGDADFYDYVVIEGSIDSAQTWFNFEDGYDCRISTLFTNVFKKGTNGTESMYASRTINLLANENIVGTDTVLIRFRMFSDQLSAGWGWAIDNLEIQPVITSINKDEIQASDFKVIPNPSKGDFELNVSAGGIIEDYNVLVYNSIGKQVLFESNIASSKIIKHHINISNMPAGVYFVSLQYNNKIISRKIVIQ